ncbi:hypothetical protein JCM10213_004038 [Rhodosporidiobolus nylandii]
MLHLHLARVSRCCRDGPGDDSLSPHDSLDPLLELVDEKTREDVRKYRFLGDARRCLLGRLLARYALSTRLKLPWTSFAFAKTPSGRPYATHPSYSLTSTAFVDYNVSHDSDVVVAASRLSDTADGPVRVGVDVMRVVNPWEGCSVAEFVEGIGEQLAPAERSTLAARSSSVDQLRHALALWTLKEAYSKATGEGLHLDLRRLDFQLKLPPPYFGSLPSTAFTSPVELGQARLDSAPLRGWRFWLTELRLDGDGRRELYWLAVALQDAMAEGRIELQQEVPEWVSEVGMDEILRAAESGVQGG